MLGLPRWVECALRFFLTRAPDAIRAIFANQIGRQGNAKARVVATWCGGYSFDCRVRVAVGCHRRTNKLQAFRLEGVADHNVVRNGARRGVGNRHAVGYRVAL